MAFFDKLSSMAKTASDKAGTALEIGKLNLRIKSENGEIDKCKLEMGQYLWEQHLAGQTLPEEMVAVCQRIQASLELIENLQAQIQDLKANNNGPAQEEAQPAGGFCIACGAQIGDAAFCPKCGAKQE